MNSYLLHGRRAFRSSSTAGVSTWTFDIASATYTGRQKAFGSYYAWMAFTQDGRLFLSAGSRVMRTGGAWPCIYEYDSTSPYYDPTHPLNVNALKDTYSAITPIGPWSQGAVMTRDGVNFYAQTYGTIGGLSGEWYVKTQLDEAWNIASTTEPKLDLTGSGSSQCAAYASRGFVAPFAADAQAGCCDISLDGKKLYFLNAAAPYNLICKQLVEAHDLTSMKPATITVLPLSSMNIGTPNWFQLSEDGFRMLILTSNRATSGTITTVLHSYDLEAAWDIGTITNHKSNVLSKTAGLGWATAVAIFPDQSGMYVFYNSPTSHIREFTLTTVS